MQIILYKKFFFGVINMLDNIKNNIGLVLEGGGFRGIFTAAILDFFIENNIKFPYVVGVSSGVVSGASYISMQKERTKNVILDYVEDKRYIGFQNLIKERSYLGIKFGYFDIPFKLNPFNFAEFYKSKSLFKIGLTNCETGKPEYVEGKNYNKYEIMDVIRASGSLPFLAPVVNINENPYLDGGISDSIPVKQAVSDGCTKNVIVLTREKGYKKEPFKFGSLAKIFYKKYPNFIEAMINRHKMYNETIDYINQLESDGKAFVIRPENPITMGRLERNKEKLNDLYNQGYNYAKKLYNDLCNWL